MDGRADIKITTPSLPASPTPLESSLFRRMANIPPDPEFQIPRKRETEGTAGAVNAGIEVLVGTKQNMNK